MIAPPPSTPDHKGDVRARVFKNLRRVARPDSRFHFDFGEFIADFEGSEAAARRLMAHPAWQGSQVVFITPDNCLEWLRWQALLQGNSLHDAYLANQFTGCSTAQLLVD